MSATEWAIAVAMWATAIVALLGFLLVGAVVAFVSAVHLRRAAWAVRSQHAPLPFHRLMVAIAREVVAQMTIVAWAFLRRGSGDLEPRIASDDVQRRPVVLVHGIASDGTSMWGLRRVFHDMHRPTWSPHLGPMLRPIEAYAERLAPVLRAALASHPHADGLDVVAHSMGGIVLRCCLAAHPDLTPHVRRVVSLGSPHDGTVLAAGLPLPEARQLRRGTPWLAALPSLRTLVPDAHIITVASRCDAVVYPHDTSRIAGAHAHEFDHIGHAALLTHPEAIGLVVTSLS